MVNEWTLGTDMIVQIEIAVLECKMCVCNKLIVMKCYIEIRMFYSVAYVWWNDILVL